MEKSQTKMGCLMEGIAGLLGTQTGEGQGHSGVEEDGGDRGGREQQGESV